MKKEELIKKLEELDYPEIEPADHKRRLEIALLSSKNFRQHGFKDFFLDVNWLKELTMFKKIILSVSACAIVALLIVGGLFISSINNPTTVSAQGLVDQAITQVAAANPQDIQVMESKAQMKLTAFLNEAKQANDLTTIDKSAVYKAVAENQVALVAAMPNSEPVQYLRFTRDGSIFIFGLDSGNLLVWFAQNPPKALAPEQDNQLVDQAKALGIDTSGMTDQQLKQAIGEKSGHNP